MQNTILLYRNDELLRRVVLRDLAVEVGPSPTADLVVDEPAAASLLVQPRGGTVWIFQLDAPALEPRVLPIGHRVAVGVEHFLVREVCGRAEVRLVRSEHQVEDSRATQRLESSATNASSWTILVGTGVDARRVTVSDRPLRVGTAKENDLVLHDPTVSGKHCRFEPSGDALVLRDLGSTNGSHVHGMRVQRVEVATGTRVRVGRTDLCVLGAERRSDHARPPLIAASAAMQKVLVEALGFAHLPWPVLVLGPSGAGKEEISAVIHRGSRRAKGPFVALNAGGLPRELIESELFGHERGAFTGAVGQRRGAFEQAQGGTLLLDEIGELPLDMQTRLLRVLETWQIRRVGGESSIDLDVRLICATHRDLAQMVAAGTFRQDLFYRLTRLVVRVAPLVSRSDDILPLAEHFLASLEEEMGPRALSAAAGRRLLAHTWPGNARELRNVLCTAAALTPASVLDAQDVDLAIRRASDPLESLQADDMVISRALEAYRGNLSAVSRALAIPRSTLRDRLARTLPKTKTGTSPLGAAVERDQSKPSRAMSSSSSPK